MANDALPRENLVRATYPGAAVSEGDAPRMTGHFARFNEWTTIDSRIEGRFLERVAPGAFAKTIAESRDSVKVLFNHGKDPQIGDKPLGTITSLEEDGTGARYDVALLDTSYNRDLIPGLRAGVYGASFRFSVVKEDVVRSPKASEYNPGALPERTIREARLFEFGPVTFPAYAGATASVRSLTDVYTLDRLTSDPERLRDMLVELQAGALDAAEPAPATPETRAVPVPVKPAPRQETTPMHDSLKLHPVEQEARITELETSLRAQAETLTGIPSVEERARWDSDTVELTELRAARAVRAERSAFLATIAPKPDNQERSYSAPNIVRSPGADIYDMGQYGPGQVRSYEDRDQKLRDNAMRSLDASSFAQSNVDQARAKEGVQELLDNKDSRNKELAHRILLTGSPQYKRAFADSLVNMRPTPFLDDTHVRAAALAVTGTTTTGGYMLPYVFDPTFIKTGAFTNINPFRQVCRVEQIVGGNKWQGVSVGAVPAIYETEALAITEAGPTFSNPSVQTQRASAFVSLSYETLQDRPSVVAEIADLIQEGKDTLEEAQFSIGAGTTVYPLGMFVKSTFTVKETITNDTFAVADLDATEADLPIRFRRDAIWMLSRGVIRIIQGWETAYSKLFNSTLGYPAVGNIENNPGGNTGLSLLGYPVFETPSAPVTVTSDDTIVGILVSPKNYIIVDRVGMNVELVPNLIDGNGKVTGQRGIFAMFRNSAKALNADAGRQININ
ncbi:Phage major capsid protein, HK97 [uncultured Caudovirales phage]|uniref:Phage major capsid protein, HK97 n=1 Tax=uncultured Caudovirales phage TaxID=2100421 RepID=A0A6J5PR75_9CAUD|nr:Phage major capsid protein, HK97 [uncultured Caudovirales phage]